VNDVVDDEDDDDVGVEVNRLVIAFLLLVVWETTIVRERDAENASHNIIDVDVDVVVVADFVTVDECIILPSNRRRRSSADTNIVEGDGPILVFIVRHEYWVSLFVRLMLNTGSLLRLR
jgi:hypothetical protein